MKMTHDIEIKYNKKGECLQVLWAEDKFEKKACKMLKDIVGFMYAHSLPYKGFSLKVND